VGADSVFHPIDAAEMPQLDAEEWRPMLSPTGAKAHDFRHPRLGEPSETWRYWNAAGLLEGYVCRFETVTSDGTRTKEFRPLRYGTLRRNGNTRTGWHWKGWAENRPLYGLCELLAQPDAPVIVVEGERKVEAARRLFPEYVAVSPMNGAKSPHKSDWTPVAERKMIIWPDHDEPGHGFAEAAAKLARGAGAASITVVTIPREWPEHWDLANPLPDGISPETLTAMLKSAEPRVSVKPDRRSKPKQTKALASEEEITAAVGRLATMSRIKYEIERDDEAARLGIRVSVLDRLVDGAARIAGEDDVKPGQGRPVKIPEVEPWPESVDGAELLDGLTKALHRYVILPDARADAIALWAVRTHAHDAFEFNPLLWLKSIEKRSGKTRLCEELDRVVARPLLVSSISPSALLRVIEVHGPTVLLDELDPALKKSPEMAEALRGLINSSFNRRTARHIMNIPKPGGGYEPREFSMWAPLVLSGIGGLPDTAVDRAIRVEMKRKLKEEKVERLRQRDGQDLSEFGRKAARWAQDNMELLRNARPEMPEWLNDRAADAWEPLFAIADLADGDWRQRCENAARALSGGDGAIEHESLRIKLLSDIRDVFDDTKQVTLFSSEIVERLVTMDHRPWAEWGKDRKPITATAMSRLLSELLAPGIKVGPARKGNKVGKGYHRKDLEDSFERYLPHDSPSKELHSYSKQESSAFRDSEKVTLETEVTFSKSSSAAETATCNRVTRPQPSDGGIGGNGADFDDRNAELPLVGSSKDYVGPTALDRPKRRRVTL
jgi:uncharacterized protein DUF3631